GVEVLLAQPTNAVVHAAKVFWVFDLEVHALLKMFVSAICKCNHFPANRQSFFRKNKKKHTITTRLSPINGRGESTVGDQTTILMNGDCY
ncbi:MAG: hypothetical protein J5965_08820, partial [Aeriscardovia sp.]|nr:hypothetical protein [Aeriscardovia sp.]